MNLCNEKYMICIENENLLFTPNLLILLLDFKNLKPMLATATLAKQWQV